MAKFLITIQVNLVPIPSKAWRSEHKFAWIVVIKNFAIILPSQPLLGRQLGFHNFFHGPHLFLQLGCFCVDIIISETLSWPWCKKIAYITYQCRSIHRSWVRCWNIHRFSVRYTSYPWFQIIRRFFISLVQHLKFNISFPLV